MCYVHLVGLVRENKYLKDGTKTVTRYEFVVSTKVTVSIHFVTEQNQRALSN
jgi:hypothetical protein